MMSMTTAKYISKPLYQMVAAVAVFTLILSLVYGVFAPAHAENNEPRETESSFGSYGYHDGDSYTDTDTDDTDDEHDAWDGEDEDDHEHDGWDNTDDDHEWSDHDDEDAHGDHDDEDHDDEDHEDEHDGWGWGHGGAKVWICHTTATGYEQGQKVVPQKGIPYGHGTHTTGGFDGLGDIIPPLEHFVEGLNWDAEHIAIFNADCKTTGEVVVTKVVVGGSGKVSDFNLFVGDTTVLSGKKKEMTFGTYTVSETSVLTDYVASFSGGCDSTGSVTVVPGERVHCTITNTYTPAVDVCPNIPEMQTVVPEGYVLTEGQCVLVVIDVCSNIDGVQATVPTGYALQNENQCIVIPPSPTDVCPNIPEMQTVVPEGYVLTEGQCVVLPQDIETYRIYGYVWHDKNENDAWEGFESQNESESDTEVSLNGWNVTITNGSTTHATISDSNGYYEFIVPAGTWTITEGGVTDWSQTFPNVGGHTVTVPEVAPVIVTSAFSFILEALVPTAHAAVSSKTYGAYNFGNVYTGGVVSTTGSGGGGHGRRAKLADATPTDSSVVTPTAPLGEVLGESTSILPVGAPNTGAGGAAGKTTLPTAIALLGVAFSLGLVRVTRNVR